MQLMSGLAKDFTDLRIPMPGLCLAFPAWDLLIIARAVSNANGSALLSWLDGYGDRAAPIVLPNAIAFCSEPGRLAYSYGARG
jgi:hypothetical protein